MNLRKSEVYGDVSLSVQASKYHYCTPRVDDPDLDSYSEVELGLLGPTHEIEVFGCKHNIHLCRPSDVGIEGFDHLFENGDAPVAGFVPISEVERLREALRVRAQKRTAFPAEPVPLNTVPNVR